MINHRYDKVKVYKTNQLELLDKERTMYMPNQNLSELLSTKLTMEATLTENQSNEWSPLLQNRGPKYKFNNRTIGTQIIGPVSDEFQTIMSREQLKHSQLVTMSIEDLLKLRHDSNSNHLTSLSGNSNGNFDLDLDTKVKSNSINNSALNLFKHDTVTFMGNHMRLSDEVLDELFHYLLVTDKNAAMILSIDENWDQLKNELNVKAKSKIQSVLKSNVKEVQKERDTKNNVPMSRVAYQNRE